MLDYADYDFSDIGEVISQGAVAIGVPAPITASEWADRYFYLPNESSNDRGRWETTPVQRAILNSMGSDAIPKVDFYKPTRFGGTKMTLAAMCYFIEHKRRSGVFYQPTQADSDGFVKRELHPLLRQAPKVGDLLVDRDEKSTNNTLGFKLFEGCSWNFKGGSTPRNYEAITASVVILDELTQYPANVGLSKDSQKGSPTVLAWGRVRNATFPKQIQNSKPGIEGVCLLERSALQADDLLTFRVPCPECGDKYAIEWGGPEEHYGFKWTGRDASTVAHVCKGCGVGWYNNALPDLLPLGHWEGDGGYATVDGIDWTLHGEPAIPPRHIAFHTWSAYSEFTPWVQLVEEFLDALGDAAALQSFTNNTLAKTWELQLSRTLTEDAVSNIIPTDNLSDIVAVTAGIDTQPDRLEVQYIGHDRDGNIYVLQYDVYEGDANDPDLYLEMAQDMLAEVTFEINGTLHRPIAAGIDTQGHNTAAVHDFLKRVQKYKLFFGVNGVGTATYEIGDKPIKSQTVTGGRFYNVGTNTIKQIIYAAIRGHDKGQNALRIWSRAQLPSDYAEQLTAENMELQRSGGVTRIVFKNDQKKRNEALDTMVYAIAAKGYLKNGQRGPAGRALFAR